MWDLLAQCVTDARNINDSLKKRNSRKKVHERLLYTEVWV